MSSNQTPPLIVANTVGLTGRWLDHAPRLKALTERGWKRSLTEVLPAVTSTCQATFLTGRHPDEHGIVANGWLFRDTMEVRFWQQSNRLLQAEPLYTTLRRQAHERGKDFRCAKLFWWFNQGADVALSVTPKPYYGADGNKVFGISGAPSALPRKLEEDLGPFPFATFWGPMAGLPATAWIARAAAEVVQRERPDLTLVYLPHLDYDPQRHGPSGTDMARVVGELDDAMVPLLNAAQSSGARLWILNEYGHRDVSRPLFPNRWLREAGLLTVRQGPFGETIDLFESRAVAVCDHQLCHLYVNSPNDIGRVVETIGTRAGLGRIVTGDERADLHLDHERSGEVVLLSEPDAWFAYPYWNDDRLAPDFARTVDIHRKIGFDPCEMFFDPELRWPKARAARRLLQKKLGFRTLFDVVPLDATLVRGSHGLPAEDPRDRPLLIGDGPAPDAGDSIPQTAVHELMLGALTSC
ncbi:Type I phosphodiesterase / nucleotide pyrophosphatase [Planctomycetes bacterium Pan216]|uniref:Type I phosphodiesterase / nucleotide pyrophosphatase n=1 Tax=Kolteria novifilia TaxID=2527975 RepID=A0A518B8Y6_9BACT|nr:Type I phosphodiesterase / nucleotide pyrophosphatase [Planctomycetes bacterium Pan216]